MGQKICILWVDWKIKVLSTQRASLNNFFFFALAYLCLLHLYMNTILKLFHNLLFSLGYIQGTFIHANIQSSMT